jgi:2-polyprenyl-3-methyl-5-hydroxy-6-metoxy-1,4-benzoquinol methylase
MKNKLSFNKQLVHDFWNKVYCGDFLYLESIDKVGYESQSRIYYELEGELISGFANFTQSKDLKVLEIGVGLGADHQRFAENGTDLFGIDLTERAISHTKRRCEVFGLKSHLQVGDAENLEFPDGFLIEFILGECCITVQIPKRRLPKCGAF